MRAKSLLIALAALAACATPKVRPEPAETAAKTAETKTVEAPAPNPDAVPAAEQWRANEPTPGPAPTVVTPTFEKATLPNGLTVLVSRRTEIPIVSVGVVLRAGSAAEPAKKAGLASLTWDLLLEGTGKLDALALDDAFADIGAAAGANTGPDGATVSVTVLSRNAEKAVGLLSRVVRSPRLAKKDFDRKKKERQADLARMVGNPQYLAREAAVAAIYGPEHPYGHLGSGTPATLSAITYQDVKGFYRAHAGPKDAALVMTGDVTLDQAVAWAKKYLGAWRGRAKAPAAPPAAAVPARKKVILVPRPGLGQTIIVVGRPALAAGNPDEWALQLAGTVFGGAFGSRLNMNLREDKGYTYGAFSYVDPRYGEGPLVAMTAVRADVTGDAVKQVMSEVDGMRSRPVTQAEMTAARDGVVRSIPGRFETVQGLFGTAASLYEEAQPLDRFDRMVKAYEGLDLAAVRAAAAKYIEPEKLQIVLVGDPKIVEAQLPALGLGEIETRVLSEKSEAHASK